MALTMKKEITLTGESRIDNVTAEVYRAVINSDNPEDMTLTAVQRDKALYKANRTQCRADNAAFEELAYTVQDEMIAQKSMLEN